MGLFNVLLVARDSECFVDFRQTREECLWRGLYHANSDVMLPTKIVDKKITHHPTDDISK